MSALGTVIQFLVFAATSPLAWFAVAVGLLLFLTIPLIPKVTNRFHSFARLHLWVGTRMLKRAAFVVSPHGDLLLKRLSPDDAGTEMMEFEDDTKEFEDPTNALHWWYGIPFALADEVHGLLFDPRQAAVGMREKHLRDKDIDTIPATEAEMESHEVIGWCHGAYEFARDTYEIVDLGAIRYLMCGSERAEHPQRVKEFYKNSRLPFMSGRSTASYILIIVAVIAPFVAIWILASQLGTPQSTDIVAWNGLGLLLVGGGLRAWLADIDWRRAAVTAVVSVLVLTPLPLAFGLLYLYVSPVLAVFLYILLGFGFWVLPVLSLLFGRVSTTVADAASGFLFRLGFMGYDRPVFEWTPQRYRVRELSRLDDVDESGAAWYGFAGTLVGFTYQPGPESWTRGVVPNAELENKQAKPTGQSNIPVDLRIWDGQVRDRYGAIVPKQIRDGCYYVYSALVLEDLAYAATGEKSTERLTQSKDEFGENESVHSSRFGLLLLGASSLSFAAGVLVFIV